MHFDSRAGTYDLHAGPQRAFAAQAADVILSVSRAGQRVVELGAGTGALTRLLCAGGLEVTATDASPAMVAIGSTAEPRAEWQLLDAFLRSPPAAALQVSTGLLQWAPDPLEVLQRWSASLSPGGTMIHAFPCRPCLQEWYSLVPRGPLTWHNQEEWVKLFEQAGLCVIQQKVWTRVIYFNSALDVVRSMHYSGVTGPRLLTAGELRRAIRQYELNFRQAAGVPATWVWQLIEARLGGPA